MFDQARPATRAALATEADHFYLINVHNAEDLTARQVSGGQSEDICALPVSDLAADDAMLYLWATAPKLAECMKVIEAWGFEYCTCMIWDKEVIGMGYQARNQHEILLIGKRGKVPTPAPSKRRPSVYRERRGKHSAKPTYFYEMIEAAYPELGKIELFSRSPREGWDVWGNQAAKAA